MSQYANSSILTSIIGAFFDALDQTKNIDDYFDLLWNVDTAQGYGLDCWGRIVGVSRIVAVPGTTIYLGFEEAATSGVFGVGIFFSGSPLTNNFILSDDGFRTLILAKALANISDGSIPSINRLLLTLFPGRGNCYVTDGLDMTMTYTFTFALSAVELSIVQNSGALPRPAGVSVTVIQM